ncbi:hypothetical protein EDB89DRAFT_2064341 [Lactarius sanguifluus]|nr:hypothetical protein EDB89DRAFT_2064341 [Lactarius sanguifluus]
MPVPSTALVTALPSLYLNSKAPPTPPLSTPPRRHRLRRPPPHSHTHPYRLRSHSRSSLSSVPPPLSTSPRRLCLRRPTLALVLTLTGFVPTPAAPNLEWQWNIDPPTHRTSPPDTPEVSFGLYLTSSVSLQTLPDAHWPGLVKVASAGLTNAVASSVSLQTPPDAHGPGLIKVASAEPSPIKAPVIHHSHSISTSAKPKTVAQGRSLPTNLPPLVALDLYLTNIVGLTSAVVITPGKSTFAHLPLSLTHSPSYASYLLIHRPPIASYPSCVLSLPLASSPSSANRIIHPSLSRYPVSHLAASSVALVPPSAQGPELVKVTM